MAPTATYDELIQAIYHRLPITHARMQAPGTTKKYRTVHHPLTPQLLTRHWEGTLTLAAQLIDTTGQSKAAAADIDAGSETALQTLLDAAAVAGYTAFAISSSGGTDGHAGGHVWLLFDQATEPERLRQLMGQITQLARVSTPELYPSGANLRLPFGRHTWTGSRGTLLTQTKQRFNLDDPAERQAALETVLALPRNHTSQLPAPPVRPTYRPTQLRPANSGSTHSTIADFNQQTDLLDLLIAYGARIAERRGDGGLLLHCPCPHHQHHDRIPSLELRPAINPRHGRYIAIGYAPTCLFYVARGEHKAFNTFDAYCALEGLNARDAVRRLAAARPPYPTGSRQAEASVDPEPEPPRSTTATRNQHRAERVQRSTKAHALHEKLTTRADHDPDLTPCTPHVLDALIQVAQQPAARNWCRPSTTRLAAMTGYSRRTIYRALAELEAHGYIASETPDGRHTTIRRFLRVTSPEHNAWSMSPVLTQGSDPIPCSQEAWEPPPHLLT